MIKELLLFVAIALWLHAPAQLCGRPIFLPEKTANSENLKSRGFSTFCTRDQKFTIRIDGDLSAAGAPKTTLAVYSLSLGEPLKERELSFDGPRGARYLMLAFFFSDGHPCLLYRWLDTETGHWELFAERYDPRTLEPIGDPVTIGEASFEPGLFLNDGPAVQVITSPDSSNLLFYFDKGKLKEMQVILCWVTDAELAPVWNGTYLLPAQSLGFKGQPYFTDDATVYLHTTAVMLDEDHVKQNKDGETEVKVVENVSKHQTDKFYRLKGSEQTEMDLPAPPPGFDGQQSVAFVAQGDRLRYAYMVFRRKGANIFDRMWATGWIEQGEQVGEPVLVPVGPDVYPSDDYQLLIAQDGSGYLVGSSFPNKMFAMSFAADGQGKWQATVKWARYSNIANTKFIRNGKLYIAFFNFGTFQRVGSKEPEVRTNGNCMKYVPLLMAFNEKGEVVIQDMLAKEDMKAGKIYFTNGFQAIQELDHFVTYRLDKEAPGWLHIPVF